MMHVGNDIWEIWYSVFSEKGWLKQVHEVRDWHIESISTATV